MSQSTNFSHVGTFPGLSKYQVEDKVSCSRTQHCAYGEATQSQVMHPTTEPLISPKNICCWYSLEAAQGEPTTNVFMYIEPVKHKKMRTIAFIFLSISLNNVFWVLKRTVSMGRFF